jgi:hypothetical protein
LFPTTGSESIDSLPTLTCTECERRSAETACGWQGYLVDLEDDGKDEVVFFCPSCAAREFGSGRNHGGESSIYMDAC